MSCRTAVCQKCHGNGYTRAKDGKTKRCKNCKCSGEEKETKEPLKPTRLSTLGMAGHLTSKERDKEYGPADRNFDDIAQSWSVFFGIPITASDVAIAMALVKIQRLKHNPTHEDSWVDLCGYAALGSELSQKTINPVTR